MTTFWRKVREMVMGIGEEQHFEVGSMETDTHDVSVEGEGDHVQLHYTGSLAAANDRIYVHYGIGPGEWHHISETVMEPLHDEMYRATIPLPEHVEHGAELQFCFRNEHGEWDNNNGQNWSFPI